MRELQEQPLGSLLRDTGVWLGRMLWEFANKAGEVLVDVMRGDTFCPVAMTYGRYIPCFGDCYFHELENNPKLEESKRAIKMALMTGGF